MLAAGLVALSALFTIAVGGHQRGTTGAAGSESSPSLLVLQAVADRVKRDLHRMRGDVARKVTRSWIDAEWPEEAASRARTGIMLALESADVVLQWVSLIGSHHYGAADVVLLEAVLARAQSDAPGVRSAALEALDRFNSPERDVIERMGELCRESTDPELRAALLRGLASRDSEERTLRLLLADLAHDSLIVRRGAADGMARINLRAPGIRLSEAMVTQLARGLEDDDPSVRAWTAQALERAGPRAVPASSALVRALSDPRPDVVRWASLALVASGAGAVEALGAALQYGTGPTSTIVLVLRLLGGPEVVRVLRSGLSDDQDIVRAECAVALYGMGDDVPHLHEVLADLLGSDDTHVLLLALGGLHGMRDNAPGSRSGVEKLLAHDDARVRASASAVLTGLRSK